MAHERIHDVMVIDNVAHRIHKVVVHQFKLGDVDDPELYAAQPLWEWQQSEAGKYIMENSVEVPMWHRQHDTVVWGYSYAITA